MQSIRSQQLRRNLSNRRGVTTVLAAILMVTMLGFVAFGVDVGYMLLVKTQLQVAADSAAMAAAANMSGTQSAMDTVAQQYAAYHQAGGKTVTLQTSDIQYGLWDSTARTFTSSSQAGNAIRVTARRDSSTGGNNTFFGRIFGINSFNVSASAVSAGESARYLLRGRPFRLDEPRYLDRIREQPGVSQFVVFHEHLHVADAANL